MNNWNRFLVLITFCALLFDANVVDAQRRSIPNIGKIKKDLVPGTGELVKEGDIYFAKADVGLLKVGKKYDIKLTFKNPYDDDVEFYNVSKKCSCSSFRPGKYVVPARGERSLKLSIKTPARSRTGSDKALVEFVHKGNTVIRTEIHFQLDGVLAFGEPMAFVAFKADETEKEIEIPIVTTGEVDFDSVEVAWSDNLKGSTFDLKAGESGGVLKAKIPDSVLTDGTIRGEIYITSPKVAGKDGFFLVLKDRAKNEISPKVMNFRKKDGRISCTAIVQVAGRGESSSDQPIQCHFGERLIDADVKKLKQGTFRVQLTLNDELVGLMSSAGKETDENSKPLRLVWSIDNGKKVSTKETAFVIDPS